MTPRTVVCVGLGGVFQGYIQTLLDLHSSGICPFEMIMLVDGKTYDEHHRGRQYFQDCKPKAMEQVRLWQRLYPQAPLRYVVAYVDKTNIATLVPDGAIIMIAPDNAATRLLVSQHVETALQTCLLLAGGNDAIDEQAGTNGSGGAVIVHCKSEGKDLTAPITRHHPEIAQPADRLPNELSCIEQAQAGAPQVLITNRLVGAAMALLLERYLTQPPEVASQIVELRVNARAGAMLAYSLEERPISCS